MGKNYVINQGIGNNAFSKKSNKIGGFMKKTKVFTGILLLLMTSYLFSSEMYVVGEVFTQTW